MPPQPPPHLAAAVLLLIFATGTTGHTCSTPPSPCPPFASTPPFPFSPSPGCGHPSFPIKCATPRATIAINNLTFSLLRFEPNSTSLLLSPQPADTTTIHRNCTPSHSLSIPTKPINLSASPFHVSDSSCSRLSVLKPCPPPNLPNCSHCSWQCKLIKNPVQLLHESCGSASTHPQLSEQGCQADILEFLDNFLTWGIEIEWDENQDTYFSKCKDCQSKSGVCGYNSTDPEKEFICVRSRSQVSPPWISQQRPNRIAILSLIFLVICLLLVATISTIIVRSRPKLSNTEEDPAILYLHRHRSASLLPPTFTYAELAVSTNNFDPKRKIGDGGFGSVYLGQLQDDRIVAVKYLHKHQPTISTAAEAAKALTSTMSFCNEILILSSINHPNLVKLHGYCSDQRGLLLVYDYVPNGTLADHLHGSKSLYRKSSLKWQVRVDMALQIAIVIEYLHYSVEPPIVHRDITSSNIFIEKDMRVKVGDFGLSRLLVRDTESVWTGPQGTPGYLDPEYYRSFHLTEKSDVYSFGVVLLELVTGMRAVDQRREKREVALADLAVARIQMGLLEELVDLDLVGDGEAAMAGVAAAAELAFRCVAADKDDRPDAREVVAELRRIRSRTRGVVGPARSSNSTNHVVPES
ncbi:hypothetical protein RJ639_041475 [Escallonia herrerae]|uniref:Protein kinase domain-containing protein n=1 Tax=Escallonia herrerae TaxID=1293975 RepID=A0AA89BCL1_9ASTE|nr:hypothetical protein RJ639_041475 [Escallonia herrerae]